jgi:hypothetical protein
MKSTVNDYHPGEISGELPCRHQLLAQSPTDPLSKEERQNLAVYEETIAKGEGSFVDVGLSLAKIRDEKLYRDQHKTLEGYCRNRWQISRARAYQVIGAAEAATLLSTIVDMVAPSNESQVRPLVGRSDDDAIKIWKKANSMAAGAPVTGRLVKQAIKQLFGEVPKPERPLADLLKSVARTCHCLTEQFSECELQALNYEDKSILRAAVQAVLQLNIKAGCFDPLPGCDQESFDRMAASAAAIRALGEARTGA